MRTAALARAGMAAVGWSHCTALSIAVLAVLAVQLVGVLLSARSLLSSLWACHGGTDTQEACCSWPWHYLAQRERLLGEECMLIL